MKPHWATIGKFALAAVLGGLGAVTAKDAVQTQAPQATSLPCPACAPVINVPKQTCDIKVNGVTVKP